VAKNTFESDGESSNALARAILEIRETAIELGGALSLLAEHVTLNGIVHTDREHPCDGIAKAIAAFGDEVQMLYLRYKLTR
jgi:hypothetical protein